MGWQVLVGSAGRLTVAGLIVAAAGVAIQILSGASYPSLPPVFFILLVPVGLIVIGRWWWTPLIASLGGLFLIFGLFASGAVARLFDPGQLGVAIGLWVQMLGVLLATVAGIVAVMWNYRTRSGPVGVPQSSRHEGHVDDAVELWGWRRASPPRRG